MTFECKTTGVRGTRTQASDDIDQKIDRIFLSEESLTIEKFLFYTGVFLRLPVLSPIIERQL